MEMSLVARQEGTVTEKTPRLGLGDAEFQALQNAAHFGRRDGAAQFALQPVERQLDGRRRGQSRASGRPRRPPARMPGESSRSSSMARARPRTVLAGSCAFSKRMEASVRSLMADEVLRIEAAWKLALSSTTRVVLSPMALSSAADHAGQRDGAAGIGDHQVGGVERVLLVVQRAEMLAGRGRADEDGVAVQQVGVEGVHGLRQLRHDEVRHVDDVVDGVQADGGEPVLQPERRRPDGDVFEDQRAVPRAQVQVFDLHLDGGAALRAADRAAPDRSACCPRMAATSRAMP